MALARVFQSLKFPDCQILVSLMAYERLSVEELLEVTNLTDQRLKKSLVKLLDEKLLTRTRLEYSDVEFFSLSEDSFARVRGPKRTEDLSSVCFSFKRSSSLNHTLKKTTSKHDEHRPRVRVCKEDVPEVFKRPEGFSKWEQKVSTCFECYSLFMDKTPEAFNQTSLLGMFYTRMAEHYDMDELKATSTFAPAYNADQANLSTLIKLFGIEGTWWLITAGFGKGKLNWLDKGSFLANAGLKSLRSKVEMAIVDSKKGGVKTDRGALKGQAQSHWLQSEAEETPRLVRY